MSDSIAAAITVLELEAAQLEARAVETRRLAEQLRAHDGAVEPAPTPKKPGPKGSREGWWPPCHWS